MTVRIGSGVYGIVHILTALRRNLLEKNLKIGNEILFELVNPDTTGCVVGINGYETIPNPRLAGCFSY
jgi:hypothetical protein